MRVKTLLLVLAVALFAGVLADAQQRTGSIDGVVKDEQGGVLPGTTVSISSPALIGGLQTAVTGANGRYSFTNLPPGTYTVLFEMAGFGTFTREGIVVSVASTSTVNGDLRVGGIEESITVTGESPVVDVRTNITQTNIDAEVYENVPTGQNPWVMAALVPGVVAGRLDVGGTEGFQQYDLEAFGSSSEQKSFSIDGLKTNWTGGGGGSTMQYYDYGMYDEYNFQTASGTAQSDVGGIYMNMVTRSGGDNFSGSVNANYMGENLQSDNVDDDLRQRIGIGADDETAIGGNPIKISYDLNAILGGPIAREKAWFFGSFRLLRMDQWQVGASNPDGSPAINDNRMLNGMGKVTYQPQAGSRIFFMFNRNQKTRFHRIDAPYLSIESKATSVQDQPAQNWVLNYNKVFGEATLLDFTIGRMWGTYPETYQPEVGPDDITVQDAVRNDRFNAANGEFRDPNSRLQFQGSLNYYMDHSSGTHDFKFGFQVSREYTAYDQNQNHDIRLDLRDGVPFTATLYNTPVNSDVGVNTWGAFVQDSWVIQSRLSLNLGIRFDGIQGFMPAQSSPAGTFIGARDFEEIRDAPDWPLNVGPRMGFSYDLFGDGRTAIKGYWGRFYNQIGSTFPFQVNANDKNSATVEWNDLDGDLYIKPGPCGTVACSPELGPFTGFGGGSATVIDPDITRPYSDETNFGVMHTLLPNLSLDVSYHRRTQRNGTGLLDQVRTPDRYTAETRTYDDPVDGPNQTITIYNLDPELISTRDQILTNVEDLKSTYNGVHIQMNKRMSNNWQLLGGLTLQKHEGFYHSGTLTSSDFNNPNVRIGRDGARIFNDVPWVFTVSGSYMFPHDIMLSGKYTGKAGAPLNRTYTFGGLTQASETVYVVPRGTDRSDSVTQFVDIRISKSFDLGGRSRFEIMMDMFNILNSNPVLLQTEAIGSRWSQPQSILAPRIIRFGGKFSF